MNGVEGLEAGGNLATALLLLQIIDGVSTKLYEPPAGSDEKGGKRFEGVLKANYPWDQEAECGDGMLPEEAAEALYKGFPNPIAHHLGAYNSRKGGPWLGEHKGSEISPFGRRDREDREVFVAAGGVDHTDHHH